MLTAVSQVLSLQGYDVVSASGPRQALEIVRTQTRIQLILADIEMPEMRGTQLICEVARLSPHTAGLLMTGGNAKPPDLPEGVAVVKKPFSTEKLILAVQAALALSAELSAQLRDLSEKAIKIREESRKLISEAKEVCERKGKVRKDLSDKLE
jgi:DNA-binding NtrC family response regulator